MKKTVKASVIFPIVIFILSIMSCQRSSTKKSFTRWSEFIEWYASNHQKLIELNHQVIELKDGNWAISQESLDNYTSFLANSSFFTKSFIQSERDGFTSCLQSLQKGLVLEMKPCVWWGDPLSNSQDPFKDLMEQNGGLEQTIKFTVKNESNDSIVLLWDFYGNKKEVKFQKENGVYKLEDWPINQL